jgi:hypothetical protein
MPFIGVFPVPLLGRHVPRRPALDSAQAVGLPAPGLDPLLARLDFQSLLDPLIPATADCDKCRQTGGYS